MPRTDFLHPLIGLLVAACYFAGGAVSAMEMTRQLPPMAQPQTSGPLPRPAITPVVTPTHSPLACIIQPIRSADIGIQVPSIVAVVDVERGHSVTKGQVLARLRAEVEQALNSAAQQRANSEAEWRAAIAGEQLALQKLRRQEKLAKENFVSTQAVEIAESEHRVARERVSMARDQRTIAAREAGSAAAQLGQRVIRAPFDGVITERFANPGERFEEKPLFRIADISRLRVDVVAPSSLFGLITAGQTLIITPELAKTAPQPAKVVLIDKVLDPASNTFRIRAELDNADGALPAGLRCHADTDGKPAAKL